MNEGVENMRTAVRIVLGFVLVVLIACASATESRVLGKWTDSNTGAFIEFLKDGRLQFGDKESSVTGNWTVVSDGRVKIEISGGANSFVAILRDDATLVTEVAGVAGATFKKR
jgi:hypothetical protein